MHIVYFRLILKVEKNQPNNRISHAIQTPAFTVIFFLFKQTIVTLNIETFYLKHVVKSSRAIELKNRYFPRLIFTSK